MKTLVVLTDFTIKAENAAFYSLSLARQLKADIFLCHVLPVGARMHNDIRSGEHADNIDAMYDLAELAGRLKKQINNDTATSHFKPMVTCAIKIGTMANVLNDIGLEREVTMAVISARQSSKWMALLMGSNTNELIENTNYPVLVIPYGINFRGLKTIAFATDLTDNCLNALHTLSGFAAHADAEIVITYIANKKLIERGNNIALQNFFNLVSEHITYPKKRYQIINDKKVVRGLRKLPEKINVDMIVVVHRKRNYLQQLLGTSISLIMTNFLVRPMLIFPSQTVHEAALAL